MTLPHPHEFVLLCYPPNDPRLTVFRLTPDSLDYVEDMEPPPLDPETLAHITPQTWDHYLALGVRGEELHMDIHKGLVTNDDFTTTSLATYHWLRAVSGSSSAIRHLFQTLTEMSEQVYTTTADAVTGKFNPPTLH